MIRTAYLGIDGGGTKTDAAIVDADGNILSRRQGETSSRAVVGLEQATCVLERLIAEAAAEANIRLPITAAWIGMAGSDRPEDRGAFTRALGPVVGDLRVTNDAELVLSATPDGTGIALIAGTGSIAYARTPTGETGRSGGWGHIFGDEGSAYMVAVEGLRAVAAAVDGRGPGTTLTDAMMDHWAVDAPQGLITRIYDPAVKKGDIAASAPLVVNAAASGDGVATAILERAGDALAGLVMSLARRVPFPTPPLVACTGGLLLGSEAIRERVEARLDPELVQSTMRPVEDLAVSAARSVRLSHVGDRT